MFSNNSYLFLNLENLENDQMKINISKNLITIDAFTHTNTYAHI